jgi:hypothetical protein
MRYENYIRVKKAIKEYKLSQRNNEEAKSFTQTLQKKKKS